jgi:hypothetical protein
MTRQNHFNKQDNEKEDRDDDGSIIQVVLPFQLGAVLLGNLNKKERSWHMASYQGFAREIFLPGRGYQSL